jgi:LAO/AO transport system kinase
MEETGENQSAFIIKKGVDQPPSVNPDILGKIRKARKGPYSEDEYVKGITEGNRAILSKAITLLESSNHDHFRKAQHIIERCLPYSGNSMRIGITGVPGAGKSTFIESFGKLLTGKGRKIAVLAIDPSSTNTHGSILGDKTRMELLSTDPNAFIRPSPSAGALGGVARKTRETIILCEAAGFDTVIVETVGVGQSETAVSSMVDFFLLLMIAGAGDELQGIKRGIMEKADLVAINKADGSNKVFAEQAAVMYSNALRLFPASASGWVPKVITCSAIEHRSINEVWRLVTEYVTLSKSSGYFESRRKEQAVMRMHDTIHEYLKNSFYNNEEIIKLRPEIETKLNEGTITSYKAAWKLLNKYFSK